MSTKTTFKRIALVTVAALGLGVLSVAPSSAAPQADKLTLAATTASTTQGTAVSVNATLEFSQETSSDTMTLTLGYVSAPSGFSTSDVSFTNPATAVTTDLPASGLTAETATATGSRVAKISATGAGVYVNKTLAVTLGTAAKVGTYVVRVTPAVFVASGTAPVGVAVAQTITFTVAAKTIGSRSAFIGTAVGATDTATADAAATSLVFDGKAATGAKARLDVAQMYGATGNDTASAADGGAVVVTIDKGLVSKTNDYSAAAASVTTAAATSGAGGYAAHSYWVFANGTTGKATITITVGGVALTSKTVTFTGVATAIVATLTTSQPAFAPVAGTTTYTITATDSAGGAATALPTGMTVKSSDTSVAEAAISGNNLVTITGKKAGTATITVTDPATTSAATAATFVATVKAVRPTTAPTITFDKTAYNVGEVITMTVNADMADSATASALFTTALVTSAAVNSVAGTTALSTSSAAHAIASGKATYKFYAPAVSGSFTVTGKTGATVDITTAVDVSTTVDITNPGVDAATVAAEAAEAAAQDATDAALDATEAAQEAGALAQEAVDLVTALSAEVTKLIAGVRASITYLTKLVMKLAAKK
jgi:hypothetical protein